MNLLDGALVILGAMAKLGESNESNKESQIKDPEADKHSRHRDAGRSRQLILDAAERLFAEHGYESTSLKGIGEAAGLSRGTPTYFFGSKQAVYAAVKERLAEYVRDFAEQARATEGSHIDRQGQEASHESIAAAVRAYIDFLAGRPAYMRFIEREASGEDAFLGRDTEASEEARNLAGSLARFGNSFLEQELERGGNHVAEEEVRRLSASMCAVCCFPFLLGGGMFTTFGLDPSKPGFKEQHKEHAVQFILRAVYG